MLKKSQNSKSDLWKKLDARQSRILQLKAINRIGGNTS